MCGIFASVPRRALAKMPHIVPRAPIEGDVQLDVDVRGTASKPSVTIAARGFGIHAPRDVAAKPFDAAFDAAYDGARAAAKARVQRESASLLDAHAEVDVAAPDLLAGKTDAWTASAGATLHDFPVQTVTAVGDKHERGDLSGSFELKDLHKDATVDARFDAKNLRIGRAQFTHGLVTVAAKGGALDAHVRLDQTDGYGDVSAKAGLRWGAQVAPSLDPARPIEIGVDAKQLRAAAAKPFVEGAFSELDGRVDANLKMTVRPDKTGQATGAVVFDKGVLEMPALGEELKNAHAKVSINPWGTVRVDDVSADGSTGHFKAWGTAKVDGLAFRSAEGHLRIDRGEALPIAVQGVSMGEAWGSIDTTVAMKGGTVDANVNIPSFHLDLPQSSAHPVQGLDPDPTVKIGVKRKDGRFVAVLLEPPVEKRASNATHLHITTHLGDDVEIRRDHTLQIDVTGSPVVDVAEAAKVSGKINLVRGKIEVQGKIFQIEKGTVSFTGQESANPVVVATAYYDAPDGTRVYADFTGPVKTGKLSLRSEPSHTQDEILAILLFGSPEGSFGASAPPGQEENAAAKAAGLGGSYVAQGINKALSGISNVEVATRVDTSEANNPRPELEVQLSKDVGVQVVYNMGVPGPGQIPDRTLLMIDWRFVRRWMVETTLGDAGSSMVDLIWRYRY
jgi:translocation and assembly module TamB